MTRNTIIQTQFVIQSLNQLRQLWKQRLQSFFNQKKQTAELDLRHFPPVPGPGPDPVFVKYLAQYGMNSEEYAILLTAIAPHVQADFFDQLIQEYLPKAGDFPQIGGMRGKQFRGFLPTGETVLFFLAGEAVESRIRIQQYFDGDHFFFKNGLLRLQDPPEGEPRMSGKLLPSQECLDLFLLGQSTRPGFSTNFPAKYIETPLDWADLVLHEETMQQIRELETWVKFHKQLDTLRVGRRFKPGFRALFHGPPGTGKTLTSKLLGKYTGRDVFRIDLSMVVSKYIGETEKNLQNLFAKAEDKDWILFFDEADALFGKRTNVKDAHDKYANQEVAYLLQRIEEYNGLVILASNLKSNIDDAFTRRFDAIIHFPLPKTEERLNIWKKTISDELRLDPAVDLRQIARKYELSGAAIVNVVQFCCMRVLERGNMMITEQDIQKGISREFQKEGKILH